MKAKSITKQRASSRKRNCPREDVPVRGNSPDWYTRENIPYVGENFNALTSTAPQPGVMFDDGVSTNASIVYYTVIHPPIDRLNSFYKKAADFYAEIREKNSGAANYNVMYLAAYMYDVGVLHALAHSAARAIKAIRSVMPSSADSPYILSALTGSSNYQDVTSRLAVLSNQYSILAKDIENLPLPHVTAFDRSRFLYSSLFADSTGPKPALVSFVPNFAVEMVASLDEAGRAGDVSFVTRVIGASRNPGQSHLDQVLTVMTEMLERITNNPVFTIIRGDIRNAFGNSAYWEGLVQLVQTPLNLVTEDKEVMSQLENMNIIPRDTDAGADVTYSLVDDQYVLDLSIDGINDSPSVSRLWLDNNLVNWHGTSISDGELLAITRMMYLGRKVNRATKTDARITSSSGNTVYYSECITALEEDRTFTEEVNDLIMKLQTSSVQSTAMDAAAKMAFLYSTIAHSPMLIFKDGPRAYMWNLDNFTVLSNINVENMTIIANRSLWDVHLPRGEMGRLEKKA